MMWETMLASFLSSASNCLTAGLLKAYSGTRSWFVIVVSTHLIYSQESVSI